MLSSSKRSATGRKTDPSMFEKGQQFLREGRKYAFHAER